LMERDRVRDLFWAAFDAFVPGTPDPGAAEPARKEDPELAAEEFDGGGMDAPVARSDDRAPVGG
jgi:lysophospholipase